jgi:hypothetical protein
MRTRQIIRPLFIVAALYDGVLGAAFLVATATMVQRLGVTPPNHPGYLQFPAALLLVFAIMFLAVAVDPVKNRNLIPYGILLKVSYCGVVSYHWFTAGVSGIWKPFCILDVAFLLLFAWAWAALRDGHAQER